MAYNKTGNKLTIIAQIIWVLFILSFISLIIYIIVSGCCRYLGVGYNERVVTKAYKEYKYSDNGSNIYVDYSNKDTIRVLNYSEYNFDPVYMLLNNCVPITLTRMHTSKYFLDVENSTVICLKDYKTSMSK